MKQPNETPSVACIVHHDPADLGLVADFFREFGVAYKIYQPNRGDVLPKPGQTAGAIVFGGAMSANDDHDPAIRTELAWIKDAMARDIPMIGICLGAQMIARVNGARVAPREDGLWEIGYRGVVPTADGSPIFSSAKNFFQWHREGFSLPSGAVRLAGGDLYPEQAYRIGRNVLGFQFHPEPSARLLRHWHDNFGEDMLQPGADPVSQQQKDDVACRPAVEQWLRSVLKDWQAHVPAT